MSLEHSIAAIKQARYWIEQARYSAGKIDEQHGQELACNQRTHFDHLEACMNLATAKLDAALHGQEEQQ